MLVLEKIHKLKIFWNSQEKREILKETRLGVFYNGARIIDTAEIKRCYEDISRFVHFT